MEAFEGRTALVTGAASGMGLGIARGLSAGGARVVLWDLDEAGLQAAVDKINSEGGEAHGFRCDVSNRATVASVAAQVKAELGEVDLLVNNAGVVSGGYLLDIPDEKIEQTFAVNTLALYWVTRAFLPGMIERNAGQVVTLASASGYMGVARLSDYSASKWAAIGFDESLRVELRSLAPGVGTTVICPFFVNTGMFDGVKSRLMPILKEEKVVRSILRAIRLRRRRLVLPWSVSLLPAMRLLPVPLLDAMANAMGVNRAMDEFKGRAG
ncbi:MAG: SDR family oxidoreductase [Proteobacteria bacterium]|nr:SDR family oxidoreductase [Pseudomonadota bacterium]